MSEPRVAILTVTTNAAAHLPVYLAALQAITYSTHDLWLVDNASADGSAALVPAAFPGARVLCNAENLGFTGACNRALRELLVEPDPPPFVLFLNDDTAPEPGFLEPLVAAAGERTLVAPATFLSGRPGVLDDAAGTFDWWRGTWDARTRRATRGPAPAHRYAVDIANLSCLLVPLQLFRDVGLLDDAFFVYYDDTDLCRRAASAGYRIVVEPASVIFHEKGATLGGQASAFGCYYLARNRPYLVRKHRTRAQFAAFFAYFLATRIARSAAWAAHRRFDLVGATWRGVWDFLRGRMGRAEA